MDFLGMSADMLALSVLFLSLLVLLFGGLQRLDGNSNCLWRGTSSSKTADEVGY
jgi:hypothetical protein